jgi:hypothetical protein
MNSSLIWSTLHQLQYELYRLISVLSPIFEKVIYHRLLTFINKHGLLSNFQFGFREKSSTTAPATEIVDEILGAIDGKKIVAGLLGLEELDTIDRVILLKKLNTIQKLLDESSPNCFCQR